MMLSVSGAPIHCCDLVYGDGNQACCIRGTRCQNICIPDDDGTGPQDPAGSNGKGGGDVYLRDDGGDPCPDTEDCRGTYDDKGMSNHCFVCGLLNKESNDHM